MHEDAIAVLEAELHALCTKAAAVEAAIAALRGDAPRTLTPIVPLATDGVPTDRSWQSVAARIEHAQRARGWSQREVARRAGVNVSHVGNVLRRCRVGSGTSVESLRVIARALGVSEAWLIGGAP